MHVFFCAFGFYFYLVLDTHNQYLLKHTKSKRFFYTGLTPLKELTCCRWMHSVRQGWLPGCWIQEGCRPTHPNAGRCPASKCQTHIECTPEQTSPETPPQHTRMLTEGRNKMYNTFYAKEKNILTRSITNPITGCVKCSKTITVLYILNQL